MDADIGAANKDIGDRDADKVLRHQHQYRQGYTYRGPLLPLLAGMQLYGAQFYGINTY